MHPPGSQIGPITAPQRQQLLAGSLVAGAYEKTIDRESAYERLRGRTNESGAAPATSGGPAGAPPEAASGGLMGGLSEVLFGRTGPRGAQYDGLAQTMAKSAVRTAGTTIGREIIRGVLGGLLGGGSRSRRR